MEFVHVNPLGENDPRNRQIVRSQAMKYYRARQRAQREGGTKTTTKKEQANDPDVHTAQRTLSIKSSRTSSKIKKGKPKSGLIKSEQLPVPKRPLNIVVPDRSRTPSSVTTNPAAAASPNMTEQWDTFLAPPSTSRSHSLAPVWQGITTNEAKTPTSHSSRSWSGEDEDPFESPAQIEQMFAFCKSYIHWLRPGTESEHAKGILVGSLTSAPKCPMLLAACCLASVGHLDAVQPNRQGGNYNLYKARVLREVAERMQSPDTAVSDETVGALGCLLSYEMSRGSEEALTHLHGLKSIMDLKDRQAGAASTGLPVMLQTLDLVYAVVFNSQPVLTESNVSPVCADDHTADEHAFAKLLPLLSEEQEQLQQATDPHAADLRALSSILRDARACLQHVADGSIAAQLSAAQKFREELDSFGHIASQHRADAPDTSHLARTCFLVLTMVVGLVVHGMPYNHIDNKILVDELSMSAALVRDITWQNMPYLHLYILLSGAVAATDQPRKSYFKAQLVRCIYQLGSDEWRRVKAFVLRFLDMKRILERPNRTVIGVTAAGAEVAAHSYAAASTHQHTTPGAVTYSGLLETISDYVGSGPPQASLSRRHLSVTTTSLPDPTLLSVPRSMSLDGRYVDSRSIIHPATSLAVVTENVMDVPPAG